MPISIPILRRSILSLGIITWGAVILYFYFSGRIVSYLAPDFRGYALIGAIGMITAGILNLLASTKSAFIPHDHKGDPDATERGDLHPLVGFSMLVLPLLVSSAWSQDEFSTAALERKGLFDPSSSLPPSMMPNTTGGLTKENLETSRRKDSEGDFDFNLMELSFASRDPNLQNVLQDINLVTQGRWVQPRAGQDDPQRSRLYRLLITCCIADARVIPILVKFDGTPPDFQDNAWVRVRGVMSFPNENGAIQPVLIAHEATIVDAPAEESFFINQ